MVRAIQSKLLPASTIGALVLGVMIPSAVSADIGNATYTYDGLGRLMTACDAMPASGDLTFTTSTPPATARPISTAAPNRRLR